MSTDKLRESYSVSDKFEWTDELVKEFATTWVGAAIHYDRDLADFKQSKQQSKEPLFVTFDNVPVYEGDEYWYIMDACENGKWEIQKKKAHGTGYNENYKRFSTESAAKEYIINNKPCLSLNDILKMKDIGIINPNPFTGLPKMYTFCEEQLKELIKQKLNL